MKVDNFKINGHETSIGDCCPECGGLWDGGDIYERYVKAKFDKTDELHNYYKDKTVDEIINTFIIKPHAINNGLCGR